MLCTEYNNTNLDKVYYSLRYEDGQQYLIEASQLIKSNANISTTSIHNKWCRKRGSIAKNLDIIKPSDWWAFGHPKWLKDQNFPGSIPGEIYANALYFFAPRTGIAIDPMAGSGMLKRVYDDRHLWQKDSNLNLEIHLLDLHPHTTFIKQHDAQFTLPIQADWIFIDPPYFGQSDHLYQSFLAEAKTYASYLAHLQIILSSLCNSLNQGGRICILLPKWSGLTIADSNYDTPRDAANFLQSIGMYWVDTAFVSRGRQQEKNGAVTNHRAKSQRRMISDTCILNVFEKSR